MANRFRAAYPGECSRCPNEFNEGAQIGYDDEDELVCSDCLDSDEADQKESVEKWYGFWGEHA